MKIAHRALKKCFTDDKACLSRNPKGKQTYVCDYFRERHVSFGGSKHTEVSHVLLAVNVSMTFFYEGKKIIEDYYVILIHIFKCEWEKSMHIAEL